MIFETVMLVLIILFALACIKASARINKLEGYIIEQSNQAKKLVEQNRDKDKQLEGMAFARELSTAPPSQMSSLLVAMQGYFGKSLDVVTFDRDKVMSDFSRLSPGWENSLQSEPDCQYSVEKDGLRVVVTAETPFMDVDSRNQLENYGGYTLVAQFAMAIWYNAHRTRNQLRWEKAATKDHLTGLLNRRGFTERFKVEIDRATRLNEPLCLAYFDLDGFKTVNDTWGHEVGDLMLKAIAEILLTDERLVDVAARVGGDEFCLLFPSTDEEGACQALRRVCKLIDQMRLISQPKAHVTASIGLVMLGDHERMTTNGERLKLTDGLIRLADQASYAAKEAGKNQIVTWSTLNEGR